MYYFFLPYNIGLCRVLFSLCVIVYVLYHQLQLGIFLLTSLTALITTCHYFTSDLLTALVTTIIESNNCTDAWFY